MATVMGPAVPGTVSPAQYSTHSQTGPVLPEAIRQFTAFAGFGTALLTFGISSTMLYAVAELGPIAYLLSAISGLWAVGISVWSVLIMRRGSIVAPNPAVVLLCSASVLLLASLVYGVWFSTSDEAQFDVTVAGALVLQLMILAAIGRLRRVASIASAGSPPAGRLLLALAGSAVLVSTIVVPGLAATTAGEFAVPHGNHGAPAGGSTDGDPELDRSRLDKLDHHGH